MGEREMIASVSIPYGLACPLHSIMMDEWNDIAYYQRLVFRKQFD
jgi:hypothetical protein